MNRHVFVEPHTGIEARSRDELCAACELTYEAGEHRPAGEAQFPVMRLQELYGALMDLQRDGKLDARSAYDATVRVLDQNTDRIGSLCDVEGCGRIVVMLQSGLWPWPTPECSEHGPRPLGVCRLVTAWKPIER